MTVMPAAGCFLGLLVVPYKLLRGTTLPHLAMHKHCLGATAGLRGLLPGTCSPTGGQAAASSYH